MSKRGMSSRYTTIVGTILIALMSAALADETSCRTSPRLVDQCFVVHGRLTLANGNPSVRIWQVGTKHMLGILDSNENELDDISKFPREIRTLIPQDPWKMRIYGDYTVCPFEKAHPGWMQNVCIAGATHLFSAPIDRTHPPRKEPGPKP